MTATAAKPHPEVDHGAVHRAEREAGDRITRTQTERAARIERAAESLAAALVAFQEVMPRVAKKQTATIAGRDGKQGYSYKYADLADVSDAATPVLTAHHLAFTCLPRHVDGSFVLVGRLTHGPTGETVEGELPLHGRSAQDLGSSITYGRRYLLGCMTGIVTDEDDDGQRAHAAQGSATTVDREPAAARLWAQVQETTHLPEVQRLWNVANGQGLLDVEIVHMDGGSEVLRDAIKRYGDALQTAGA